MKTNLDRLQQLYSLIEMQYIIAELMMNFQFSLPAEKTVIKRAPVGGGVVPMVVGKEELNVAMPLRVSLVNQ